MGNFFRKPKPIIVQIRHQESFRNAKKVCAIFDFHSVNPEELSFEKNDVLVAVEKPNRLWWLARHEETMKTGYIPRNFVVDYENCHIFLPAWHEVNNVECNRRLMKSDQVVGTFLVRPCSDRKNFVLSVKSNEEKLSVKTNEEKVSAKTNVEKMSVKNYKINFDCESYYIFPNMKFTNPAELIRYYSESSNGLCCKLGQPYVAAEQPILQFRSIEVNRLDFQIISKIGQGHFCEVFMAKHRTTNLTVAVKKLRQYNDDRKSFIKEATLMHRLHHDRIVRLLGVCTLPLGEPMFIITEYMKHGSLLGFLKKHENDNTIQLREMIIILMEVAEGMAYLESKLYIHRDLRAANILVGKDKSVKVADFGLASIVEELYISSGESVFPLRWMAIEVLNDNKFTLKSDVWSFGIFMYEVITNGKDPYPDLKIDEVALRVKNGYKMSKPTGTQISCPDKYFTIMQNCWKPHRERPSFAELFKTFEEWATLNTDICSS